MNLPPQQSYPKSSPRDDHPPSFGDREMDWSQLQHRGGASRNTIPATDWYRDDSADEDMDSEEDDDDDDDDDDDSSEEEIVAKRLRDLEARKQILEEIKREVDDEVRRMENIWQARKLGRRKRRSGEMR